MKFGSIGLKIKQVGGKQGTVGVDAKKTRGFTGSDNFKPMLVSGIRVRDGKGGDEVPTGEFSEKFKSDGKEIEEGGSLTPVT